MRGNFICAVQPAHVKSFLRRCRTQPGQRQTVKNEEYYCHAHNRDGLIGISFADSEYPARAGFGIVNKILDEFSDLSLNKWRTATEDCTDAMPILEPALQKYQARARPGAHFAFESMRQLLPCIASAQTST